MIERTFKEDILNILRSLSSSDNPTQRDLSSHLGFSLGKTNYLIRELAKKGLVKIKNFTHKEHKLRRISYNLTSEGLTQKAELTLHFLKRKEEEYENLRREWENLNLKRNVSGEKETPTK